MVFFKPGPPTLKAEVFMKNVSVHHDSLKPQQAFVAFFDVLGFQARLRQHPLSEILGSYRNLAQAKTHSGTIPILSARGVTYHQVGSTIFSDSILFWCNADWGAGSHGQRLY
jgi:hypothetical protein